MTNILHNKKEISKKLKEKAIDEGFTISGIASIPGSSRIKLRTNAWKQKEEKILAHFLRGQKVF